MRATHFLSTAIALLGVANAAADEDVTVTVVSDYTKTVTVSEFIYTNSAGSLTTDFFTQAGLATTTSETTATSTNTASTSPDVASTLSIPTGTYYTSKSQVTTTLENGSSAVVEYVVYVTNTCAN